MKKLLLIFPWYLLVISVFAQTRRELTKVMELAIVEEGGANGAAVAWHPVQKKYYTAMAGNSDYPLEVFDAAGKLVSKPGIKTMVDLRGLWYNPKVKMLQANTYAEEGLVQYKLDVNGMPLSVEGLEIPVEKPDVQSTAALDPIRQQFLFYNDGIVEGYSIEDGTIGIHVELHLGFASEEDENNSLLTNEDVFEIYNPTTVLYTAIKGAELALLQTDEKLVELYDSKTGYMSQVLKLPRVSPDVQLLNFSFANGIFWLFDKDNRKWLGYK